jgi:hypothetical protein
METRRNNLKERIAKANNALSKKQTIEGRGNLAGMSLLEIKDDTSDDGNYEDSNGSQGMNFNRRSSRDRAELRPPVNNKLYGIGNIEDKYISSLEIGSEAADKIPNLGLREQRPKRKRYLNKINITKPTA